MLQPTSPSLPVSIYLSWFHKQNKNAFKLKFGTPEQVAARVVTAEVNRDGIFEVTLIDDPYESNDSAYVLHYLSTGKRGNKHYITKFFISRNQLYALTAQIKEENYNETTKEELFNIVNSFSLL